MPLSPNADDLIDLLAPLWRSALSTEIGPESDFIALGGNSLSAAAIADAVARAHPEHDGIEVVALQAIFEGPTLRATADAVSAYLRG